MSRSAAASNASAAGRKAALASPPGAAGSAQATTTGPAASMPRRRACAAMAAVLRPPASASKRSLMRLRSARRSTSCRRLRPSAVCDAIELARSRACSLARRSSASRATRKPITSSPATSGATSAERIVAAPQSVPASTEVSVPPLACVRCSSPLSSGSETMSGPSGAPGEAARMRSRSPLGSSR